jgi:hypothetical protein
MIDRRRGAGQPNRAETVFGSRNNGGLEQPQPQQERDNASLHARAVDEFPPRSSGLRKQRKETLWRRGVSHDNAHSTYAGTPLQVKKFLAEPNDQYMCRTGSLDSKRQAAKVYYRYAQDAREYVRFALLLPVWAHAMTNYYSVG